MVDNPWIVESIQAFSFLKCPECPFDTKEEVNFQEHAIGNHPLSIVFFDSKIADDQNEYGESKEEIGLVYTDFCSVKLESAPSLDIKEELDSEIDDPNERDDYENDTDYAEEPDTTKVEKNLRR